MSPASKQYPVLVTDDRFLTVLDASLELRRHRDDLVPASRSKLRAIADLP